MPTIQCCERNEIFLNEVKWDESRLVPSRYLRVLWGESRNNEHGQQCFEKQQSIVNKIT